MFNVCSAVLDLEWHQSGKGGWRSNMLVQVHTSDFCCKWKQVKCSNISSALDICSVSFFIDIFKCSMYYSQDLKKYHFYYWFAFPCLTLPEPAVVTSPPEKIGSRLTETQVSFVTPNKNSLLYFVKIVCFIL